MPKYPVAIKRVVFYSDGSAELALKNLRSGRTVHKSRQLHSHALSGAREMAPGVGHEPPVHPPTIVVPEEFPALLTLPEREVEYIRQHYGEEAARNARIRLGLLPIHAPGEEENFATRMAQYHAWELATEPQRIRDRAIEEENAERRREAVARGLIRPWYEPHTPEEFAEEGRIWSAIRVPWDALPGAPRPINWDALRGPQSVADAAGHRQASATESAQPRGSLPPVTPEPASWRQFEMPPRGGGGSSSSSSSSAAPL
jgi:hypothetical protein